MSEQMLGLARQSEQTDLAFLLRAKEEAKKRMRDDPTQENIGAFMKARAAAQGEAARVGGEPLARTCKTQLDAVAYLRDAGYKISKSQFNRDVKSRRVPRTPEGQFDMSALLGYANAHLTPLVQHENRALADAEAGRLSADAELKKYQAARAKLKLEKEQGQLMRREDHERDLGARALFFRSEVRSFIHLYGGDMIHLVGGDEGRLRDLVNWWNDVTARWMDSWVADRDFLIPDEGDEMQAESASLVADAGGEAEPDSGDDA